MTIQDLVTFFLSRIVNPSIEIIPTKEGGIINLGNGCSFLLDLDKNIRYGTQDNNRIVDEKEIEEIIEKYNKLANFK